MKKLLIVFGLCLLIVGCKKDKYIFTMKSIRLNSYQKSNLPSQNLFLKVVDIENANRILASTKNYLSSLTLPVTFAVIPQPELHLYKKDNIAIQLWGEDTGLIASSIIRMKEYKIIFPIDMETKNDSVSFSVMGTWR